MEKIRDFQPGSVCAVVVTFNPDNSFALRLAAIKKQVGGVVVVDNNSTPCSAGTVLQAVKELHLSIIHNENNNGIAVALNQGISWAIDKGFKWVLLMDQDTDPLDNMVETLLNLYRISNRNRENVLVGSNFMNSLGRIQFHGNDTTGEWIEKMTIITSGTLLSCVMYREIGPFRNEFFIDAVDYEYCLRVKKAGYRILLTKKAIMRHHIGKNTKHQLLWKETATSNHSPERRYYIFRNTLILFREYVFQETRWCANRIFYLLKTVCLIALYENEKKKKLSCCLKGVWHALINKTGPIIFSD